MHEKAAAGELYFIAAFANDPDTAVMCFHNSPGNCQPQTWATAHEFGHTSLDISFRMRLVTVQVRLSLKGLRHQLAGCLLIYLKKTSG